MQNGLEFSVPYPGSIVKLEQLIKVDKVNNNRITEIYLSGPQDIAGSGRVTPGLSETQFVDILNRVHQAGIGVNLVFNSVCEGRDWYEPHVIRSKVDFIKRMHKEYGLESVTIANPIYITETKRVCPELEIHASVLGDIDCLQRAIMYTEVGASVITPDANINRNIDLLKEIKRVTRTKIKLMVNEGCLYKCPFRKFHFNYISHASKELGTYNADYFFDNCVSKTISDHSQVLKSGWIRPEDTVRYGDITNFFKVVGRAGSPNFIERSTKAYLDQRWDGDLFDILSSSMHQFGLHTCAYISNTELNSINFFESVTTCNNRCEECSYCKKLVEKLLSFDVVTRGKLEDVNLNEAANMMVQKRKNSIPWAEALDISRYINE